MERPPDHSKIDTRPRQRPAAPPSPSIATRRRAGRLRGGCGRRRGQPITHPGAGVPGRALGVASGRYRPQLARFGALAPPWHGGTRRPMAANWYDVPKQTAAGAGRLRLPAARRRIYSSGGAWKHCYADGTAARSGVRREAANGGYGPSGSIAARPLKRRRVAGKRCCARAR